VDVDAELEGEGRLGVGLDGAAVVEVRRARGLADGADAHRRRGRARRRRLGAGDERGQEGGQDRTLRCVHGVGSSWSRGHDSSGVTFSGAPPAARRVTVRRPRARTMTNAAPTATSRNTRLVAWVPALAGPTSGVRRCVADVKRVPTTAVPSALNTWRSTLRSELARASAGPDTSSRARVIAG